MGQNGVYCIRLIEPLSTQEIFAETSFLQQPVSIHSGWKRLCSVAETHLLRLHLRDCRDSSRQLLTASQKSKAIRVSNNDLD
jgi:hypothetical protein